MKKPAKYNGLKTVRDVATLLYDADEFCFAACNPKYCKKTKDGKTCPGHTSEDCIAALENYLNEEVNGNE